MSVVNRDGTRRQLPRAATLLSLAYSFVARCPLEASRLASARGGRDRAHLLWSAKLRAATTLPTRCNHVHTYTLASSSFSSCAILLDDDIRLSRCCLLARSRASAISCWLVAAVVKWWWWWWC